MKKKILIPLVIFVVIVAAGGGWFWWTKLHLTPPQKWNQAELSSQEDFTINQTNGEKIIENKIGLKFKIPQGWIVKNFSPGDISWYSPDAIINESTKIPEKGCKITNGFAYIKTDIETMTKKIKERYEGYSITSEQYETIFIDKEKVVRHMFEWPIFKAHFVGIHLPFKGTVQEIILESAIEDKEQCLKDFDQFLRTISYN